MPVEPADVPRFLVLAPGAGVRLELRLSTTALEIDATLQNPATGRSFVLMLGYPPAQFVQRARIAGRAQLHFVPERPGLYLLVLTNPMREPAVVRLRIKPIEDAASSLRIRTPKRARRRRPKSRARAR